MLILLHCVSLLLVSLAAQCSLEMGCENLILRLSAIPLHTSLPKATVISCEYSSLF